MSKAEGKLWNSSIAVVELKSIAALHQSHCMMMMMMMMMMMQKMHLPRKRRR